MVQQIKSDLALDHWDLAQTDGEAKRAVDGVEYHQDTQHGVKIHTMNICSEGAAKVLCKPTGQYYTMSLGKILKRQDDGFQDCVNCASELFRKLLNEPKSCLIACLGNPDITPDAIGPICAKYLMVTRHLKDTMPDVFSDFSSVSVICPGVLGTTGIESATIIKSAVSAVKPDVVIAIDALAAASIDRLCNTIQICNAGIEPGSGVGNHRNPLNADTLGVPVISAGVPTVVDAATLIQGLTGDYPEQGSQAAAEMMVTPREIDTLVNDSAKLLAYAINLALHPNLSINEIDFFVP